MWEDPWKDLINKYIKESSRVPEQPTKFLNESSEIDISLDDDDDDGGANQTSESVLGVSDMIMKSAMDSVLLETSGNPLPDISLEDLLVKCSKKVVTETATQDIKTDQDAKDLLSIL
jgi:hypothetical protein